MKNLLKISFAISLFGILLLLFLSNISTPKLTNIKNINSKLLNKKVQVQGQIQNIKNYTEFQVITIKDETGEIDITTNKILNLTNNKNITVIGKITQYKQFLQIQADEVLLIDKIMLE